jgi:hypothetical protein
MMLLDQMDDASLVKMARGEVPTHLRAAFLKTMHDRVRKYADGGSVQSPESILESYDVATLKQMLASGVFDPQASATIRTIIAKKSGGQPSLQRARDQAPNLTPPKPEPSSEPGILARGVENMKAAAQGKEYPFPLVPKRQEQTDPAPASQGPIAKAAAQPAPPRAEFEGKPPMKLGVAPLAQAARRAPTPSQQPRRMEPDVPVPPMRPIESEAPRAPESTAPPAAPADVQKPAAKEPTTWASPLAAAGLALMASPHRNIGRAIGEAGLTGLRQMQVEEEQRRRAAELARREARDNRQLDQQAELTREQIAARKDMAEENRRMREAEFGARAADRADARSIQQQRLGLDREEAGMRKRLIEAQIGAAGQKAGPEKLIYDTAADILAKNPMLTPQDATRMAIEMYGSVMNRGQPGAMPAGPLGAIPQGGRMPDPAGLR